MLKERIKLLNDKLPNKKGNYVAYWIQASQRSKYNHALEYAILKAKEYKSPLLCFFGITKYPSANQRPYHFMIQGLQQLKKNLADRNILFAIYKESPDDIAIKIAQNAILLVVDRGYTKIQRQWRSNVANKINCQFYQVESDVLVPIETASNKEEWAAKTIRPKITKLIPDFAQELPENIITQKLDELPYKDYDISNIEKVIKDLEIDTNISIIKEFKGGENEAIKHLEEFLQKKLKNYANNRNDPTINGTSNLSPYLHFGMISPLYIYLQTMKSNKSESREAFLEELIIRRELSMNYCYYNENYDKYEGLPEWAKKTLQEHVNDKREYIYTLEQFEKAKTHDMYWNAAQLEAIHKGKISGYMRMYWGKKIIEWTQTPQQAFEILLYLNDKYHLDGRDPNGYTGVAWCFGKHDRPWTGRQIFGNVRYMVDSGLRRKFDSGKYVIENDLQNSLIKKQSFDSIFEEITALILRIQQLHDSVSRNLDLDDNHISILQLQKEQSKRMLETIYGLLGDLERQSRGFEQKRQLKIAKQQYMKEKDRYTQLTKELNKISFHEEVNVNEEQVQIQQQHLDLESHLIQERQEDINNIEKKSNVVHKLMTELSLEVNNQGQDLDLITHDLQNTKINIENANQQIKECNLEQKKSRGKYYILLLIASVLFLGTLGALLLN